MDSEEDLNAILGCKHSKLNSAPPQGATSQNALESTKTFSPDRSNHRMIRRPIYPIVLIVSLFQIRDLVLGFSTIKTSNRQNTLRKLPTSRYLKQDDSTYRDEKFPDRRRLLVGLISFGTVGWGGPDVIAAVSSTSMTSSYGMPNGGVSKKVGGLANKIRGICLHMDELQRDLMQERWDLVQNYPQQLRSYVPIFTTYTDAAFPSDLPSDYGLRVALRYEVGRFFASLERLKRATTRKSLDEAYVAYADMSLHLDRYLRVGGLYTYYDSTIDNEPLFQAYNDALVYSDPIKDPAEVRDLIVLCKGPDKGKTGIVIGIYPDESNNCVVKLDKYRGMREIRVVPRTWAAKRLGEQDPDDVFLIPRKGTKS